MPSAYVGDGYDLKSTIAAIPGAMPSIRFQYRICKIARRMKYQNTAGDEDKQVAAACELICENVNEICFETDAKGWDRLDVNAELLTMLHPLAFLTIVGHVLGNIGPTPWADAPK